MDSLFSGQVEAFPIQKEKASEVVKTLLKEIIPQLRLPYSLQFSWAPKSLRMLTAAMKLKDPCTLGKKKQHDKPRQHIKRQRHHFADESSYSQSS